MLLTMHQAGPADEGAMAALDPLARTSAERRALITEWVALGQAHVAFRDGRPAGYEALTRGFFRSPFVEMLMVAEGERRLGVGSALLGYLGGLVPAAEKLWTSTNTSNAPMRALLARAGFVPAGRVDHLDEGDPELVFVRLPSSA